MGPAVLSGTDGPAVASPHGNGRPHTGVVLTSSPTDPAAARSRPAFAAEGRHLRRSGESGDAPAHDGHAPANDPLGGAAPSAGPTGGPTAGGAAPSTSGNPAGPDASPTGGDDPLVEVQVDDDGVVVDGGVTGPLEVPLPDLGL